MLREEISMGRRGPQAPDCALERRRFVQRAGLLALGASPLTSWSVDDKGEGVTLADGPRSLVQYPGKRPLIRVSARPPHLETPFAVFDKTPITPNDAFFVRYHLANLPLSIDSRSYRLSVRGEVDRQLSLSMDDLRRLGEWQEVVAVNQCSGNSRAYAAPRVFGAQLGNGAMGNARWMGIPLRKVLERAGVKATARTVVFNGLDTPVLPTTPDFRKSLEIDHALGDEPLLAWSMNGDDLPVLNGYPLKLIVPGWFGTYWVKHLSDIELLDSAFVGHDAFFMTNAYRVPDNDCQCVTPGSSAPVTRPISTLPVRSFITNIAQDAALPGDRVIELRGIAFDSGAGLKTVEVSIDGGLSWRTAQLGSDLGRFSFREWKIQAKFPARGRTTLMVRASNRRGESQSHESDWNPSGYRRHAIETIGVTVV